MSGVTAILLAGERPGGDPFAAAMGVAAKALIQVGGVAMGERVARLLAAYPAVARVRVFGVPVLTELGGIAVEPSGASIAATLRPLVAALDGPLLVTTADHALLTPDMLDSFIAGARGSDLAVGLVERRIFAPAFPDNRRTWLKFRGGAYSGANLFWIGSRAALPLIERWAAVEQQRKRGRALIGAFGPLLLIGVATRILTIDGALARLGRRYGATLRAVRLPQPEACIDVDKPADLVLAEAILAARP
ncbi:MobA-like NTP transferase domain-containing protein [Sphingomonas antarctica]|uniref:NTP transferase domain-containing protein n=1 Tax=Sphingomonas antarctica TaxID=2040274 RepID=UPI0039E7BABE